MIIFLKRSIDLRWLFDDRCYIHLRWSCSLRCHQYEFPMWEKERGGYFSLRCVATLKSGAEERKLLNHIYQISVAFFFNLLYSGFFLIKIRLSGLNKKSGEMLLTKQDVLQLRKSLWFFVQSGHCEVRQWPAPTTTVTTIARRSHQQDLFHNLDWISQQQKLSSSVLLEVLPERDASKC